MSSEDKIEGRESARSYYYGAAYGYGAPAYGESDLDGGFSLKDIVGLLRRRWEVIASCIAIGTVAAAYWGYLQPVTYSATARLLIEPDHRVVEMDSVVDGIGSDAAAIETQLNLFKANGFLEAFVETERAAEISEEHALSELIRLKGPSNGITAGSNTVLAAQSASPAQPIDIKSFIGKQAEVVNSNLHVSQEGRSFIINVAYTSTDPHEAARTANDLAAYYIDDQVRTRRKITGGASTFLQERLQELELELVAAEEAVHTYRSTNRTNTAGKVSVTDERLSDIISILVKTRAERVEKEARLDYIRKLKREGGNLGSLTEVRTSPYMASLWEEESRLRNQEAELNIELGASHPRIIALNEEQSELRERMNAEVEKIINNMSNELHVIVEREHSLEVDMEELSGKSQESLKSSDYAAIRLRSLGR